MLSDYETLDILRELTLKELTGEIVIDAETKDISKDYLNVKERKLLINFLERTLKTLKD